LPRELKHWPRLRHQNLVALIDCFQVSAVLSMYDNSLYLQEYRDLKLHYTISISKAGDVGCSCVSK
jgi:hypothetical protein